MIYTLYRIKGYYLKIQKINDMNNYNISCSAILNTFEDGWEFDKWNYEDLMYNYCEDVLYIPESKITEFLYGEDGIEIVLDDLNIDDISDDWYINLQKIADDIYTN